MPWLRHGGRRPKSLCAGAHRKYPARLMGCELPARGHGRDAAARGARARGGGVGMALWRYTLQLADGTEETNLLAAGNGVAARERALRNAAARGAKLVEGPHVVDATRGSM